MRVNDPQVSVVYAALKDQLVLVDLEQVDRWVCLQLYGLNLVLKVQYAGSPMQSTRLWRSS